MQSDNYLRLVNEIRECAIRCGRDPDEITLIAVTKTHPWDTIAPVYDAGCRQFGESRVQEALDKMEGTPDDINWHFIGTLQKNKVKKVISRFSLIHSIDSLDLAKKVSDCSQDKVTPVLLQVNTSRETTKHGLTVAEWRQVTDEVLCLPGLKVEGLMTIGPNVPDEGQIRRSFRELRDFRDELGLHHLSMGMSDDYPIAIEEGATFLRIGTAIFGLRYS